MQHNDDVTVIGEWAVKHSAGVLLWHILDNLKLTCIR